MIWHSWPQYIIVQSPSSHSVLLSPEFLGAFSGAFFAFVFGIISYRLIKRYERFIKHRDALVSLERLLNEHLDLIGINRSSGLKIQRILENHKLAQNRLIEFPLRNELNTELGSIEIANLYFSYERRVQRTNIDAQSLNYTLTRFEDVMIGGRPLESENWHYITGAFAQIPGFMDKLEVKSKELLVIVRIYIRHLKGRGIWFANLQKSWDYPISSVELKAELEKLDKEIISQEK